MNSMLGALIIFSCGARSSEIFAVEPGARSTVLFCLKNADKHDPDQCYTLRLLFNPAIYNLTPTDSEFKGVLEN